jgi:hypothetical protein
VLSGTISYIVIVDEQMLSRKCFMVLYDGGRRDRGRLRELHLHQNRPRSCRTPPGPIVRLSRDTSLRELLSSLGRSAMGLSGFGEVVWFIAKSLERGVDC